jgi:hypothetical protein
VDDIQHEADAEEALVEFVVVSGGVVGAVVFLPANRGEKIFPTENFSK